VADFAPAGTAHRAGFAHRIRREIVVVDEAFLAGYFHPLLHQNVARSAEGYRRKSVSIAAHEDG